MIIGLPGEREGWIRGRGLKWLIGVTGAGEGAGLIALKLFSRIR